MRGKPDGPGCLFAVKVEQRAVAKLQGAVDMVPVEVLLECVSICPGEGKTTDTPKLRAPVEVDDPGQSTELIPEQLGKVLYALPDLFQTDFKGVLHGGYASQHERVWFFPLFKFLGIAPALIVVRRRPGSAMKVGKQRFQSRFQYPVGGVQKARSPGPSHEFAKGGTEKITMQGCHVQGELPEGLASIEQVPAVVLPAKPSNGLSVLDQTGVGRHVGNGHQPGAMIAQQTLQRLPKLRRGVHDLTSYHI